MLEVEIRIKGHVNRDWSNRFGGLNVKHRKDGNTFLSGFVHDQQELFGVLSLLSDLGLDLVSVTTKAEDATRMSQEEGDL